MQDECGGFVYGSGFGICVISVGKNGVGMEWSESFIFSVVGGLL